MNTTITGWNGTDYVSIYNHQLKNAPVCYDDNLKAWAVYSYALCREVLLSENVHVPEMGTPAALSPKARLLVANIARINNGDKHTAARAAAMTMFGKISSVPVGPVLEELLSDVNTVRGFDWIEVVAKRLPILLLLKGLGIEGDDMDYIAANLAILIRIMLPNKTEGDIQLLNPVVDRVYDIAEKYVHSHDTFADSMILSVCNMVSLFIQTYDAGRGLLCNTLLDLASRHETGTGDDYIKLANETLRFHPPVHNTCRVAAGDFQLGGQTIPAGASILIVMAAANIDPQMFDNPLKFDVNRHNNDKNLTFGAGGHNCLAKYFSINMAADACSYLTNKYRRINILQKEFSYEPQLNVRLPKQLMVSFG